MLNAAGNGGLERWSGQDSPLVVEYWPAAMETARAAAVDGLYKLARGGLEVGGLLLGEFSGDLVRIRDVHPISCEYAYGPWFRLSPRNEEALIRQVEALSRTPGSTGQGVVGWYRSDVRVGVCLSEWDLSFFRRYFPEPSSVALILHVEKMKPTRAGFFVRGPAGVLTPGKCGGEFEVPPRDRMKKPEPPPKAVPAAPKVAVPVEPVSQQVTATVDAPVTDFELFGARPAEPAVARPRRLFWVLFAVAWCLALGSLAFAFRNYLIPPPPAPVALRLVDNGGQLTVLWNVASPEVKGARSGVLEITDGANRLAFQLNQDQSRSGSFTYARRSGDVQVRLGLALSGGESAEGSSRFAGEVVRPVPPEQVRELTLERDALAQEVERLRADLERQSKPTPKKSTARNSRP